MRSHWLLGYFLVAASCGRAQSIEHVINSEGGEYRGGYYQVEWSVGEMALVNQMQPTSNTFILTNGFLQPYSLFPARNFPAHVFMPGEVQVFPNPASDFVEIDFFTKEQGRLNLRLVDASGKVFHNFSVNHYGLDLIYKIPVKTFASGTYFLHVTLTGFDPYISTARLSKRGVYKIIKIP